MIPDLADGLRAALEIVEENLGRERALFPNPPMDSPGCGYQMALADIHRDLMERLEEELSS